MLSLQNCSGPSCIWSRLPGAPQFSVHHDPWIGVGQSGLKDLQKMSLRRKGCPHRGSSPQRDSGLIQSCWRMSAPWSSEAQISGLLIPGIFKRENLSGTGEKRRAIWYLPNNMIRSFFYLELSHSERSSSCFTISNEEQKRQPSPFKNLLYTTLC